MELAVLADFEVEVGAGAVAGAADEAEELAAGFESLGDFDSRQAFVCTLRNIIDPGGQRVSGHDRLYLAEMIPTLLVWGERDRIIPVAHGQEAHVLMPHSRLEVFEGAGHFPFNHDPGRFVSVLEDFIASTEPAVLDKGLIEAMLRRGPVRSAA